MTLLEPGEYWSGVPSKWRPYMQFHNIPVDAGLDAPNSPLNYIRLIATPNDFVSFKLDVDKPNIEIPIAMEILHDQSDPPLSALVDEFFFELHFRYFRVYCGWIVVFVTCFDVKLIILLIC